MNPAPYIGPLFRLNAACTALITLQRLKDIHSFIFRTLFSLRQNAQLGMHLSVGGGGKHANETLFLRAARKNAYCYSTTKSHENDSSAASILHKP